MGFALDVCQAHVFSRGLARVWPCVQRIHTLQGALRGLSKEEGKSLWALSLSAQSAIWSDNCRDACLDVVVVFVAFLKGGLQENKHLWGCLVLSHRHVQQILAFCPVQPDLLCRRVFFWRPDVVMHVRERALDGLPPIIE